MPRFLYGLALLVFLPVTGEDPPVKEKLAPVRVSADPADWPMYNHDLLGTRYNAGEKSLTPASVGDLVEKWRFPPRGSFTWIGAIHATPVVVNGHVYFGTATLPAIYRVGPDGKQVWVYRNPRSATPAGGKEGYGVGVPDSGYCASVVVSDDTVFAGDLGGFVVALDRDTGKERWKIDTRAGPFPGAHGSNCIFASPILVEGKLIIAGGGYEHGLGASPRHKCCTGRGFVAALDPRTGKALWKYDVGPTPVKLDPPVRITDDWGEHVFYYGPSTSSVWSTPSHDPETGLIYFGTDAHNAPRQPTRDDPRLYTKHSCALIALDAHTGSEKWVTQINPGDVWNYSMRAYDSKTGQYKDQSIGDTPKPYTIAVDGVPTRVVGAGCKNGGFYVVDARTGKRIANTPIYTGPPSIPPTPRPDPRTLALPGPAGGLQTGCATDGKAIYTNGIDSPLMLTRSNPKDMLHPPIAGRVVSISLDTTSERWRHERPKVKEVGGQPGKPAFRDVGDPVGSGIALAGGVAYFTTTVSNRLVALETSTGKVLKEIPLGPVWSGPAVSRGRVWVGTGNILFTVLDPREAYFPKSLTGTLYSFGLPGEDEISKLAAKTKE